MPIKAFEFTYPAQNAVTESVNNFLSEINEQYTVEKITYKFNSRDILWVFIDYEENTVTSPNYSEFERF